MASQFKRFTTLRCAAICLAVTAAPAAFAGGSFSATGDMTSPRVLHGAAALADGRVLLVDPATGAFTAAGDLAAPRYAATATALPGGSVLIAGGRGGADLLPIANAEVFTPNVDDLIFADGFDGASVSPVISTYDDLTEGFLGTSLDYNGISYHDVNGIGGVFPDGSTFTPADVGDQLIIENATIFYVDFPDFGSSPNTLTFGTSFVPGNNLSIGALVRATLNLAEPATAASVDLAFYEHGPWGGIEIHLDALSAGIVVASDSLTIAGGGDRDNPITSSLSVGAATFDSLKLYATYEGQPTAPRVMIDNLAVTPAAAHAR